MRTTIPCILLALLACAEGITLNTSGNDSQSVTSGKSVVSEITDEVNSLQQSISDKLRDRKLSDLTDGVNTIQQSINKRVFDRLNSLSESKIINESTLVANSSSSSTKNNSSAQKVPEVINVTSSSVQSSQFMNGTKKFSTSKSEVCYNGKCLEKICTNGTCTSTNVTNGRFDEILRKINKTLPIAGKKFEKDIKEHTAKIMKEMLDDQSKMHEWMGKLTYPSLPHREPNQLTQFISDSKDNNKLPDAATADLPSVTSLQNRDSVPATEDKLIGRPTVTLSPDRKWAALTSTDSGEGVLECSGGTCHQVAVECRNGRCVNENNLLRYNKMPKMPRMAQMTVRSPRDE